METDKHTSPKNYQRKPELQIRNTDLAKYGTDEELNSGLTENAKPRDP